MHENVYRCFVYISHSAYINWAQIAYGKRKHVWKIAWRVFVRDSNDNNNIKHSSDNDDNSNKTKPEQKKKTAK